MDLVLSICNVVFFFVACVLFLRVYGSVRRTEKATRSILVDINARKASVIELLNGMRAEMERILMIEKEILSVYAELAQKNEEEVNGNV